MTAANRVAIVTGGGTGIGRASALVLARDATDVVLVGRRREVLERTADDLVASLHGAGGSVRWLVGDMTQPADVQRCVDDVAAEYGAIDVVLARSEEHTSELQSRHYLVCRLLL